MADLAKISFFPIPARFTETPILLSSSGSNPQLTLDRQLHLHRNPDEIDLPNRYVTSFQVYSAVNAEILTIHEVPNEQISPQCGWLEFNPQTLYKAVLECVEVALNNLILLDIDPKDVQGIAVTNQRETCLLWDKKTGEPLSNAIAWNDTRTASLVRRTLKRVKNQSSYLREVCGLPLSTCFSAFKVKWLCESSETINEAITSGTCFFGTLDTWIIWVFCFVLLILETIFSTILSFQNLTGGVGSGTHVTDVTNASRTMYFNLETRTWDKKLCEFFKVSMDILPKIKSCSEVLGYVHDGPLRGIAIYGCITEQQGALLGQMCFRREQVTLQFNADIHLLVNTGREIISSEHNMLSTVAFQLGPNESVFYALEGVLPGSGSAVEWLTRLTSGPETQNPLQLLTLLNSSNHSESVYCSPSPPSTLCGTPPLMPSTADQSASTTLFKTAAICGPPSQSTTFQPLPRRNIFFVPARDKVLLPGCCPAPDSDQQQYPMGTNGCQGGSGDPSRGLIYGVTRETTAADLTQAAYEGICFQVRQLLMAQQRDCKSWHPLRKVAVGGELMETNVSQLAQTLADYCDLQVEYPQTTLLSSLGAMLAAGLAMNVFTLDSIKDNMAPPTTIYHRSLRLADAEGKYRRWEALQRALGEVSDGERTENEEEEVEAARSEDGRKGEAVDRQKKISTTSMGRRMREEQRYRDPLYNVHRSIPGTWFATVSFAVLILADWWMQVSSN